VRETSILGANVGRMLDLVDVYCLVELTGRVPEHHWRGPKNRRGRR
jgi:hypothetical protein